MAAFLLQCFDMRPRASAGGVVLRPDGKMVLVYQHSNSWSFPKGQLNEGESELAAAMREIGEETGVIDLTLIQELGSYQRYSIAKDGISELKEWGLRKRTIFLFTTDQTEFTPSDPDGEVTDVRWVTIDEALEMLAHPKDKEFLESVRDKIAL
jgi:8-oxo-dGTP pyrophosphatase MutT (NUDIX family)